MPNLSSKDGRHTKQFKGEQTNNQTCWTEAEQQVSHQIEEIPSWKESYHQEKKKGSPKKMLIGSLKTTRKTPPELSQITSSQDRIEK